MLYRGRLGIFPGKGWLRNRNEIESAMEPENEPLAKSYRQSIEAKCDVSVYFVMPAEGMED